MIAGRWPITSAATALGQMDVGDGVPACELPLFGASLASACNASDIRANPKDDGQDLACDAISLAIPFKAGEGSMGSLLPVVTTRACPDAGTVSCD